MKVFCDQVPLFNVYLVPSIFHHVRRFVPYIKFLLPDPTLNFQLILCTNVEILILYMKLYYQRIQSFKIFQSSLDPSMIFTFQCTLVQFIHQYCWYLHLSNFYHISVHLFNNCTLCPTLLIPTDPITYYVPHRSL